MKGRWFALAFVWIGALLGSAAAPELRSGSAAGPGAIYLPVVLAGPGLSVPATETPTRTPATPTPAQTRTPTAAVSPGDAVLVGAGDIAVCWRPDSGLTAALVADIPGTVMALGDIAGSSSTPQEIQECYAPTWGAFKNRTRPAVGNHDYDTPNAAGYFGYFGAAAGDPSQGYYSYDLGSWHVVVLNSNCAPAGGCNPGNPQELWLKADLAAHPARCSLAYFHHPLFTSGSTPNNYHLATMYQDLYDAGAELVVSGHAHNYERFAPQDALGNLDPERGIVQFVAGTGGMDHVHPSLPLQPNSLALNDTDFGVLKLTLHADSYTWEFIPTTGSYTDAGTAPCH